MSKYNPNYTDEAIRREGSAPNLTGRSPQDCVRVEESAQRAVAESASWLLAKKMNWTSDDKRPVKDVLGELGFTAIEEHDDLFFKVQPPKGWTKETQGYWTYVKDQDGNSRISQFFKGAFYDRDAFLNISK